MLATLLWIHCKIYSAIQLHCKIHQRCQILLSTSCWGQILSTSCCWGQSQPSHLLMPALASTLMSAAILPVDARSKCDSCNLNALEDPRCQILLSTFLLHQLFPRASPSFPLLMPAPNWWLQPSLLDYMPYDASLGLPGYAILMPIASTTFCYLAPIFPVYLKSLKSFQLFNSSQQRNGKLYYYLETVGNPINYQKKLKIHLKKSGEPIQEIFSFKLY